VASLAAQPSAAAPPCSSIACSRFSTDALALGSRRALEGDAALTRTPLEKEEGTGRNGMWMRARK
jgi:hypothetical protein